MNNNDTLDVLSTREREILQLIAEGNTNIVIAEKLTLSVRTVEAHRAHIMAKMRFNSQSDLVRYAIQQGLITP
jgi:DNA-binding NarL/FixJ family response regulator